MTLTLEEAVERIYQEETAHGYAVDAAASSGIVGLYEVTLTVSGGGNGHYSGTWEKVSP